MTNVFAAIGSRRDDPALLLLRGADGHHDAQPLPDRGPAPGEPDAAAWLVDDETPQPEDIATWPVPDGTGRA